MSSFITAPLPNSGKYLSKTMGHRENQHYDFIIKMGVGLRVCSKICHTTVIKELFGKYLLLNNLSSICLSSL